MELSKTKGWHFSMSVDVDKNKVFPAVVRKKKFFSDSLSKTLRGNHHNDATGAALFFTREQYHTNQYKKV
jgi:hypothetical protein